MTTKFFPDLKIIHPEECRCTPCCKYETHVRLDHWVEEANCHDLLGLLSGRVANLSSSSVEMILSTEKFLDPSAVEFVRQWRAKYIKQVMDQYGIDLLLCERAVQSS